MTELILPPSGSASASEPSEPPLDFAQFYDGMSDAEALEHVERLKTVDLVAIDTETTGLSVVDGTHYCQGISLAYRHSLGLLSGYFPLRHSVGKNLSKVVVNQLFDVLRDKRLVFHNIKFDLHSLATVGFSPTGKVYCTQQMAHMVNEEWPSKKLDWLGKHLLHVGKDNEVLEFFLKMTKNDWSKVPVSIMSPYACQDAELTYRLFEVLSQQMERQELHVLWGTESKVIDCLFRIERRGIRLDRARCELLAEQGRSRMGSIATDLGCEPSRPTHLARIFFDELKLPVVERTPKGEPSFNKKAMEIYDEMLTVSDNPVAKMVLEYRGWQKSVGSFYDSWIDLCSPDGRLRPNFKLHGTKTGRFSCEKPNLQQIPRQSDKPWNGPAKSCFVAEDGYSLWEFDYSQLEFRLAAAYGNETALIEEFANGLDPFERGAKEVFGEFTKENRQKFKTLTYSVLYGAGISRIMFALGLDAGRARQVIDEFHNLYPGIYKASSKATRLAESRGFVKYWTGRRRHFPDTSLAYKAFNSVIQGGGAELVKRTMLRLLEEIDNEDTCRMVLQVHDSVWFEIRDDIAEQVKPQIEHIMSDWPDFKVPLPVEGKKLCM